MLTSFCVNCPHRDQCNALFLSTGCNIAERNEINIGHHIYIHKIVNQIFYNFFLPTFYY